MLIVNSPSQSVCMSIAWVLVMFSQVRETWDCCANQQCNVSMEKLRFLKTFQLRAVLFCALHSPVHIYLQHICTGLCRAQNKTVENLNQLFKPKILSG